MFTHISFVLFKDLFNPHYNIMSTSLLHIFYIPFAQNPINLNLGVGTCIFHTYIPSFFLHVKDTKHGLSDINIEIFLNHTFVI